MNGKTFVARMIGIALLGFGLGLTAADLIGPLPSNLHFTILTVLLIGGLSLTNVKLKD